MEILLNRLLKGRFFKGLMEEKSSRKMNFFIRNFWIELGDLKNFNIKKA